MYRKKRHTLSFYSDPTLLYFSDTADVTQFTRYQAVFELLDLLVLSD